MNRLQRRIPWGTRFRIFGIAVTGMLAIGACGRISADSGGHGGGTQTLVSIGSHSLGPALELWAGALRRARPQLEMRIQSTGTATAPAALADRVSQIAPMSRLMTAAELESFERRRGFRPTAVRVALDAVNVIVHRDNPIAGLTLQQLGGIFSAERRCGNTGTLGTWGRLGLVGEWQQRPIMPFGLGALSGTRSVFQERALCGGSYRAGLDEAAAPGELVGRVGSALNAIGYVPSAFRSAGVRTVAVSSGAGSAAVLPSGASVLSGRYPLSRYLYIYIDRGLSEPLPDSVSAFMEFVLSPQGQGMLDQTGYVPLPDRMRREELARIR